MVKDDTILLLGALGVGAFILFKPLQQTGGAIADTVGGVGQGLSTGVQGIGQGFNSAFTGVGAGLGQTGGAIGEVATGVSSPFAYVDDWFAIEEQKNNLKFQAQQDELMKMWEYQAEARTEKERQDVLLVEQDQTYRESRNRDWEKYKTDVQDIITTSPQDVIEVAGKTGKWVFNGVTGLVDSIWGDKEEKVSKQTDSASNSVSYINLDGSKKFAPPSEFFPFSNLLNNQIKEVQKAQTSNIDINTGKETEAARIMRIFNENQAKKVASSTSSKSSSSKKKVSSSSVKSSSSSGKKISNVKNWSSLSKDIQSKLKSQGYN